MNNTPLPFKFAVVALFLIFVAAHSSAAQTENGAAAPSVSASQTLPLWAYPPSVPGAPKREDDGKAKHLPGSKVALTYTQIRDAGSAVDWHPEDHPAMPEVVAHGRPPSVSPCGRCHLANGQGRAENSAVAGLPNAYFVQQVMDIKNGLRKSSDPNRIPPKLMTTVAMSVSDEDLKAAAEYFGSLKFKPWIRVVESETVPKNHFQEGMFQPLEDGGTEAIGERIVEMPEDSERTEFRDTTSGFVAYVPVGSIKKGELLVTKGGGKTVACGICHGPELRGLGNVPAIAGRSPSYIVRQLCDIQNGNRAGSGIKPMKDVVAKLTVEDMIAIAAYTSSKVP